MPPRAQRALRLVPTGEPPADLGPEALVRGLLAGDAAAAAETWRRYSGTVFRLLSRGLGPDGEVDDLAQEVFLRLFSHVLRLEDPAALGSFVVGITLRVLRKELRRRWARRWLRLAPAPALSEVPHSGADADAREALRRFHALLDGLDATARTVFVLRHMEELQLSEIARAVDLSLATVKRRLARAEARLARWMASDASLSSYVVALMGRKGGDDVG